MRLTGRDAGAAVLVAAAIVFYALWTTGAAASGLSVRWAGAVVFALGWLACMGDRAGLAETYGAPGAPRRAPMGYTVAVSVLGALALAAGIIAIVAASETMLLTLVAAMAALWVVATTRHALAARTV